MSVRSYKDIYGKFAELFPELNKTAGSWKGVRFSDKHIVITMKNKSVIHFQYFSNIRWNLFCLPFEDKKV